MSTATKNRQTPHQSKWGKHWVVLTSDRQYPILLHTIWLAATCIGSMHLFCTTKTITTFTSGCREAASSNAIVCSERRARSLGKNPWLSVTDCLESIYEHLSAVWRTYMAFLKTELHHCVTINYRLGYIWPKLGRQSAKTRLEVVSSRVLDSVTVLTFQFKSALPLVPCGYRKYLFSVFVALCLSWILKSPVRCKNTAKAGMCCRRYCSGQGCQRICTNTLRKYYC